AVRAGGRVGRPAGLRRRLPLGAPRLPVERRGPDGEVPGHRQADRLLLADQRYGWLHGARRLLRSARADELFGRGRELRQTARAAPMRAFRYVRSGAALIGLAACKDTLLVDNQNQADRNRALGTFTDLEAFLGSGYATAHNAVLAGSNDDLQTQMLVMGLENISGLANFAMGPRGAVPRVQIDNQPNGTGDPGNLRDF